MITKQNHNMSIDKIRTELREFVRDSEKLKETCQMSFTSPDGFLYSGEYELEVFFGDNGVFMIKQDNIGKIKVEVKDCKIFSFKISQFEVMINGICLRFEGSKVKGY
jgi:hypothetical protein